MAIEGYYRSRPIWVDVIPVQKFGRIPDIGSADTLEEVWDGEGVYPFLAAATAMTLSSSDVDDTALGTGAQEVKLVYLDANYYENLATLATDGQSGVATPSALRTNRAWVSADGGGPFDPANEGDLWIGTGTITTGVPAVKYAGIKAGRGQTNMAVYTIPVRAFPEDDIGGTAVAITDARLLRWYATLGAAQNAYATVELQTKEFGGSWRSRRILDVGEGGWADDKLSFGLRLMPKTDVRVRIVSNGVNSTSISAGFDIALNRT